MSIERDIGYKFKNRKLLIEALSHPSLKQHDSLSRSYEKLEFLGDSILNFIIADILFHKFQNASEGLLAKIRAHLVSKDIILKVGQSLEISKAIIMSNSEENCGGRINANNIENVMEALIAAIYLDSDIKTTKAIVQRLWQNYVTDQLGAEVDPKSSAQELAQKLGFSTPVYRLIQQSGLVHNPIFQIEIKIERGNDVIKAIGEAKSKKLAEKDAASRLLKKNFF